MNMEMKLVLHIYMAITGCIFVAFFICFFYIACVGVYMYIVSRF